MKKLYTVVLLVVMMLSFASCSQADKNEIPPENKVSETVEEKLTPLYASEIKDGSYEITVESSSSMFRVVKCVLTVKDKKMSAEMTMSGKGYGMVYLGRSEDALNDDESSYIPFVLNESGEKTFTVPVEALDMETDLAAWSIKKEKWYDRKLVFSADLIPQTALDLE